MTREIKKTIPQRLSRRQFLKITAAAGALAAGGVWLGRQQSPRLTTLRQTRLLMGTVINLAVITAEPARGQSAIESTFAEMERLIGYFDHRQPASLVARLNQAGQLSNAPPELVDLLGQALEYSRLTGGAFDISVKPLLDHYRAGQTADRPELRQRVGYRQLKLEGSAISFEQPGMAITLDGIAKGRVVDAATTVLKSAGYNNVLVEAGGDLVGSGRRADGTPWRVGIANPRPASGPEILTATAVTAGAMATSGDYMNSFSSDFRLHHILDPRTGRSPAQIASATVLAPTATAADALSTALMVLGPEAGLSLLESLPRTEAFIVTKALQRFQTSGFAAP